jgi:histidinol-phosphate/aromatic aminotransferase/cobyric acid decarboxylase-like protein
MSSLVLRLDKINLSLKQQMEYKMSNKVRIGVVGYMNEKHDPIEVWKAVARGYNSVMDTIPRNQKIEVVSNWVDKGVAAAAYRQAAQKGWKTIAAAPDTALNYKLFPVDDARRLGKKWEDMTKIVEHIDVLVAVGRNDIVNAIVKESRKRGIPVHDIKPEYKEYKEYKDYY